jgi:glycosyltransferase involved in cell wall biosynthesis
MDEKKPLVSIVVRTKDRPKVLRRALKSIASQTYRPIELILVNDGGCALPIEELKDILCDVSLNYVRIEKNRGRPTAGNVGIKNAKGQYIGFLDDDDIFYTNHIETLQAACAREGVHVAYSSVQSVYYRWTWHDQTDLIKLNNSHLYDYEFNPSRLLFENYIPLNALLFSKNVLSESGFDENLPINEDWDLLIRLSRRYHFFHVSEITAEYCLFPKDETRQDMAQIAEDRKNIHSKWFRVVFDKHKSLITGKDWQIFYSEYLVPKHEEGLQFLRNLIISEQKSHKREIREKNAVIQQKNEALARQSAVMQQRDEALAPDKVL